MIPENFDIFEFIEYLKGTCKSLFEACADFEFEEEELTTGQLAMIDGEIFCCEQCGWWCENSEMSEDSDEQICEDCNNENL
jgi:rubrerythrin